ncbi:HET-domain-containing protein [Cadophora sp. DSE1049]|nr:HET-domain-containing protein [Cadophora sp. DSE1049]
MRLLQCNNDGDFSLTEFFEGDIPKYAILSHRWEAEEVTFEDLQNGTGTKKAGYEKIRFCGEQAGRDGLKYFWVDTCCIDKSSSAELSKAINSMFRWYRQSTKCYVYLSDVFRTAVNTDDLARDSAFRNSKWFTRGWTLQELIAPKSVEFFSKSGKLLGDKSALERHVCEITGIPAKALRGSPLCDFSIAERMSWAGRRKTTYEEDHAYSLLGIFDISIPVIYGEGNDKAMRRLREEIEKASKGFKREDFSVAFSLSNVSDVEHFVARKTELVEIHKALGGNGSRRVVVLHGLGGIGKTQLSTTYAKRYKDNYLVIFWLNIKDEDSVKQSFAKVAKQILREHLLALRLSNVDTNENLDNVVDTVKAWLSLPNNTQWLIIYNNYDNSKLPGKTDLAAVDIKMFIPELYQGLIIIITRLSQVRIGHFIHIRKLGDVRDSLEILSTVSGRQELITDPDAVNLAKELDGFPLALATAGAYLDQTARSFSDYLRLYKESWVRLMETSPELNSYEDRTLYSTWHISFHNVKQQNPLSADLLRLWAYFDNQDLWFELLRHSDSEDPEWIRELTKDEVSFDMEIAMSSQGWIESKGYSIHGCVHAWTIHVLNQTWDYDLARLAVKFVASHVPGERDFRPWLIQRRLLQHATRLDDELTDECHDLGLLYANQGKLVEAEQMYQRSLQGKEKAWGPEHTSTLDTRALQGYEKAWGPDHTSTLDTGKLVEAKQMYQRALQGYEKAWGPDHTSTLDTGKLVEAKQMYQRALQGYEKAWGPDHTSTLDTGKLAEAEQMYQRALQGCEKAWGPDHTSTLSTAWGPDHTSTLSTVNNLGLLYADQGKLAEAEQMYQRALQGKEKAWGSEHTSTLDTVHNLGILYKNQGKLVEAEQMYQRALQGYEKAWGPEHTSTLDTVNNLGILYKNQGKLVEAEQICTSGRFKATRRHGVRTTRRRSTRLTTWVRYIVTSVTNGSRNLLSRNYVSIQD